MEIVSDFFGGYVFISLIFNVIPTNHTFVALFPQFVKKRKLKLEIYPDKTFIIAFKFIGISVLIIEG